MAAPGEGREPPAACRLLLGLAGSAQSPGDGLESPGGYKVRAVTLVAPGPLGGVRTQGPASLPDHSSLRAALTPAVSLQVASWPADRAWPEAGLCWCCSDRGLRHLPPCLRQVQQLVALVFLAAQGACGQALGPGSSSLTGSDSEDKGSRWSAAEAAPGGQGVWWSPPSSWGSQCVPSPGPMPPPGGHRRAAHGRLRLSLAPEAPRRARPPTASFPTARPVPFQRHCECGHAPRRQEMLRPPTELREGASSRRPQAGRLGTHRDLTKMLRPAEPSGDPAEP